ncbi:MAG TPA: hypothetical protein VFQ53_30645 [Kofleriaceae bacterium]|nr:hypothetical protein [Kofleriaceae bacterium]
MMKSWVVLVLCLAAVACTSSDAKVPNEITVELAAVTLGDDCAPPKPATPAAVAPSRCAGPNCGRRCDQTSMQLAIRAQPGVKHTTLAIKKVELLDDKGKLLQELAAREGTVWNDAKGAYVAWDQTIDASANLKTMYALAAPNWDKLTNGRWHAHEKTFQLRVTVVIGSGTRTVEKQAITPTRLPPAVPT